MRASNGVSGHAQNGAMATLAILGPRSGRAQNTHGGERSRAPSPVLDPADRAHSRIAIVTVRVRDPTRGGAGLGDLALRAFSSGIR